MRFSGYAIAALLLLGACAQTPEVSPAEEAPLAPPLPAPSLPLTFDAPRQEVASRKPLPRIDRTAPIADVWERIRLGFGMADLDDALVVEKARFYAARPEHLQRIFDRSRLYLYYVVEEIEKRGLPTELALLPMVESAYNPMAYSRAHASGLWQFIPGTGKRFELEQNWWYDARRDVVESTSAALDYLTKLYEMHGDWHLALASYNWGENAVARAVAKNQAAGLPTDYSSLSMPRETRDYVPKLQALKNIIANPEPFGIALGAIPNQPYFATVTKLRDIDVQLAARLAEMPVADFMALNPGFSRPIIRASVTPRIVLPADKVEVFHDNLEALGNKSLVTWKTYHPGKGENFESIAKKHGMSVGYLKEVNGIPPRQRQLPRLLVVPTNPAAAARLPIMYAPPIPVATRRIFHTVKKGETLASIAGKHQVSVEDLKRWNGISKAVPGRTLAVEVRGAAAKPPAKTRRS